MKETKISPTSNFPSKLFYFSYFITCPGPAAIIPHDFENKHLFLRKRIKFVPMTAKVQITFLWKFLNGSLLGSLITVR